MRKIILIFLNVVLVFTLGYTQEVYQLNGFPNRYLYLGEIDQSNYKLLDMENGSIDWLDRNNLKQIDQIESGDFYRLINKYHLKFKLSGYSPFWEASISRNQLTIGFPKSPEEPSLINIDVDQSPSDRVFLLTFKSKNSKVYGVIRGLGGDTPCDIMLTDNIWTYEVFININGKPYKGCAQIIL